jgi:hypothetical protein
VRDASSWRGNAAVKYASNTPSDLRMAYATEGTPDPYAGFEARVVPENVTLLPKTKEQITGGNPSSEKFISSRKATPFSRSCATWARRRAKRWRLPTTLARAAATVD